MVEDLLIPSINIIAYMDSCFPPNAVVYHFFDFVTLRQGYQAPVFVRVILKGPSIWAH